MKHTPQWNVQVYLAQIEDMLCEELSLMSKNAEDAMPDGNGE